ncbi:MAG: hypothetical protein AAF585_21445 [Verrucomicrobiota bacterium]
MKRYQAYPNLIWDISKEALLYGHDDMSYVTGRIDRLRRLDGHGRLLTVHDYDYCEAFPDKVDFISIQEWQPYLYPRMIEIAKRHPRKSIMNIEHGGYEKTMHTIFDGVTPIRRLVSIGLGSVCSRELIRRITGRARRGMRSSSIPSRYPKNSSRIFTFTST